MNVGINELVDLSESGEWVSGGSQREFELPTEAAAV